MISNSRQLQISTNEQDELNQTVHDGKSTARKRKWCRHGESNSEKYKTEKLLQINRVQRRGEPGVNTPLPHTKVLLRQSFREFVDHHRGRRQRHGARDLGHNLMRVRHSIRIVVLVRGRVGLIVLSRIFFVSAL